MAKGIIFFSAVSAPGYSQRFQSVSLYGHQMAIVPVCILDVGLLTKKSMLSIEPKLHSSSMKWAARNAQIIDK